MRRRTTAPEQSRFLNKAQNASLQESENDFPRLHSPSFPLKAEPWWTQNKHGLFCRFSATLTTRRSLLFNSKILNINVVSSSLELNLVPEARDLGSSGIQGSRVSPGGGLGVQGFGTRGPGHRSAGCAPPREQGISTGEPTARGFWNVIPGREPLEPPSWAGSPGLRSCGAETGRLQSPGGNPGRPCGAPRPSAGSPHRTTSGARTPRPSDRPYLVCAAFGCPGRAPGAFQPQ